MSRKRLTDINQINEVGGADLMHIVDVSDTTENPAGSSFKVSVEQLKSFINTDQDVNWGDIDGNLTDQEDLTTALGLKLNTSAFDGLFDTRLGSKTTTDLTEGSNLYFTNSRAVTALTGANNSIFTNDSNYISGLTGFSTTDLSEGSNLYYSQARFDTAFGLKSTTNLSEGNNLYYTDARAISALSPHTGDGTIHFTQGNISITESQISDLQDYYLANNPDGFISEYTSKFAFDPTSNDDDSNTGGNGTFEIGQFWLNTLEGRLFQVHDVTTGNADWREVVKLNENGELVGVFIPRHDIQETIDGIILEDGEIAFTTDRNEVRLGDGVTAGGIQAECHYTEGESEGLSGVATSNVVMDIDLDGNTITSLLAFDVEYKTRVTAYKLVNGIRVFYDQTESNLVTYVADSASGYDINVTWNALSGADGYILEFNSYIPAFELQYQSYEEGFYDAGNVTSYSWAEPAPKFNLVGFVPSPLDASHQEYYLTALEAKGGFNATGGGSYAKNGVVFTDVLPTNGLFLGLNNSQAGESIVIGNDNINVGSYNTKGSATIGFDNDGGSAFNGAYILGIGNTADFEAYIVGKDNNVHGTAVGLENKGSGIMVGSNNVGYSSGDGATLIGRFLSNVKEGVLIGNGSFREDEVGDLISIADGSFATGVDAGSWRVELNGDTIIEDLENLGSNIITNSGILGATDPWNINTDECSQGFNFIDKDADGTSTITPPSLISPLTVGRRYSVFLRFINNPAQDFVGNVVVTMGGATLGTIRADGGYWFTFTATTTDSLVLTPSNTSRFRLFVAFGYEITGGDLNVLGDINIGDNVLTPDTTLSSDGSASFAGGTATIDEDGNITSEQNITTADTVVAYTGTFVDTVTVGTRVKTFNNDGSKYTSIEDDNYVWTLNYDIDGRFTGRTVTSK